MIIGVATLFLSVNLIIQTRNRGSLFYVRIGLLSKFCKCLHSNMHDHLSGFINFYYFLFWGAFMAVITFDTLEYARNLEAKGFTIEQAEALAHENKRVFNEFTETQLATKADLFAVKEELKVDIQTVKSDIKILQWGVALILVIVAVPVLKGLFNL